MSEFEVVSRGIHFGRDAIQLRAHVETTGVVNVALFAINNDYVTYIDPDTGLPFRSQETLATRSPLRKRLTISVSPPATKRSRRSKKAFPARTISLSVLSRARAAARRWRGLQLFRARRRR